MFLLLFYLIDYQSNILYKSCRCRCFFVSLFVKKRTKESVTPTNCKGTKVCENKGFFQQIKSVIHKKCVSSGIKLTRMDSSESDFILYGHTIGRSSRCPYCGKSSRSVHDHRYRKFQCTEFLSRPVRLILRIRHFRCLNPDCSCKCFSEPLKIADAYSRMTHEVVQRVLYESINQSARLASESLARQHIQVSKSTCTLNAKSFGKINPVDIKTSGYVAVDDLAYRKCRRYMCAITDHYTRKPLALFGSRYGTEIEEWFRAHPEIRLVTRDGCMSYADIIRQALPQALQVSDRFHLIKNLKEKTIEEIRKQLGKPGVKQPYPCPTEEEATQFINEAILSMGEAPHREKVMNYFMLRKMQDKGMSIQQISEATGMPSTKVYRLQHLSMNKLLNRKQKECIRHTEELVRIISGGCTTADTLSRKMLGKLCSALVHRCVRELEKKYRELRKQVRIRNAQNKDKGCKVSKKAIWDYICSGKTNSEKLLGLHRTHPEMEQIIRLCMEFVKTLLNKEKAMNLDEWITLAEKVKSKGIRTFVEYIKCDRDAIEMACNTYYSNGMMEGTVNKIKEIKRTMFNRAGIELLGAKVIYANYGNVIT